MTSETKGFIACVAIVFVSAAAGYGWGKYRTTQHQASQPNIQKPIATPTTKEPEPSIVMPHEVTVQTTEWGCPEGYEGRFLSSTQGWNYNDVWSNGSGYELVRVCVKPELIHQAEAAERDYEKKLGQK